MNSGPKIQLLYFPGCPNVRATEKVLQKALKAIGLDDRSIEKINIEAEEAPPALKNFPSPSILINGADLEEISPGEASACRIYSGTGGVPKKDDIIRKLKENLEN